MKKKLIKAGRKSTNQNKKDNSYNDDNSEHVERKIWPVIIYPFVHPESTINLDKLMDKVISECKNKKKYENPLIVVNKQTRNRVENKEGTTEKEKKEKLSFRLFRNK